MQFTTLLFAAAASFSAVNAVQFTNTVFNNVTAGEPFTFTWDEAKGPVTITLKNGDPLNLQTVSVITSGQSGTSYTWSVPSTLPSDTYAFEITSQGDSKPNYSPQVQLIGGVTTTSATASRTGSSSSASASATDSSSSSSSATTAASNSTTTSTRSSTRTSSTATSTGSSSSSTVSPTSAPAGGNAAGLTSNLAFVFLAIGALMTLN